MWFGYFQYGPLIATRAVGRDDYWIQLPIRRQIEVAGSREHCHLRYASRCRPLSDAHRLLLGAIQQRLRLPLFFAYEG
jgi:hypothetical protein